MSEAVALFTRHMFEWLDIPRLYLFITPENAPSIAVAEKAGYRREGQMRDAVFARGTYHDVLIYSILKPDVFGVDP